MRPTLSRLASFAFACGVLGAMAVQPALAVVSIQVNSLADVAANDGACTLREAITAANTDTASGAAAGECAAGSNASRDTVAILPTGTITLTSALPDITSDMLITGQGVQQNTVNGGGVASVFQIDTGTVTIADLTISGGTAPGPGLTFGGGIVNDGGDVTLTLSRVTGNTADFGGGIYNSGTLSVTFSTIDGNTAHQGGGLFNVGRLGNATIANTTISGNSADQAASGILNTATLAVTNSTISGNSGKEAVEAEGTETLVNTIVAGNPDGDLTGSAETVTTSIIGVPGGKTLADILVPAGLADNGGSTQTIALALVAGNPAIDTGTSSACATGTVVNGIDQRGGDRPAACDIGAYEAQPPTVAAHADVNVAVSPPGSVTVTYTAPAGTDEQGGVAAVACLPASGSSFPVGRRR